MTNENDPKPEPTTPAPTPGVTWQEVIWLLQIAVAIAFLWKMWSLT